MVLNTHPGNKYSKKHLKYKQKYLLLKKQKQLLGGVPFKGKFVVFFKHDDDNDRFVKTLIEGAMTNLTNIKNGLVGAYALTSNRKKIKLLNKSGIFKKLLNYIAAKLFKNDKVKLQIKQKLIETSKMKNQPINEKELDKKIATMNITDELGNTMKEELSQIEKGVDLDNPNEYIKLDNLLKTNKELIERGINSYLVIDKGGNVFKDYKIIKKYNSIPYMQIVNTEEFQLELSKDTDALKQMDSFISENENNDIESNELLDEMLGGFIKMSSCDTKDIYGNEAMPNPICLLFTSILNLIILCIIIAFGAVAIALSPVLLVKHIIDKKKEK